MPISYALSPPASAVPYLRRRALPKLPAPYGQSALYLDAERIDDPEHIVDVALKLLSVHGSVAGRELFYMLPVATLRGLVLEQLCGASGTSPYEAHDRFHDQLEMVGPSLLPFANINDGSVLSDAGGLWLHARRRGYEGRPI